VAWFESAALLPAAESALQVRAAWHQPAVPMAMQSAQASATVMPEAV
jgi:hypothetical protein